MYVHIIKQCITGHGKITISMCNYLQTLNCPCKQSFSTNCNATVSFQYFIAYQPHCCCMNTVLCGWCEIFKNVNTSEIEHTNSLCCFTVTVVNLHAKKIKTQYGRQYKYHIHKKFQVIIFCGISKN